MRWAEKNNTIYDICQDNIGIVGISGPQSLLYKLFKNPLNSRTNTVARLDEHFFITDKITRKYERRIQSQAQSAIYRPNRPKSMLPIIKNKTPSDEPMGIDMLTA